MTHWRYILQDSITTYADLQKYLNCNNTALEEVIANFPMRINPYFLNLIKYPGDPLWKQAVPHPEELDDSICVEDPLEEESLSPVPNLVHRYPDRALFLVSNQCAMYCRFCTRKRKVGISKMHISPDTIGLDWTTSEKHQTSEMSLSQAETLCFLKMNDWRPYLPISEIFPL